MRSSFSLFLFITSGFELPYWLVSSKLVLTLPSCSPAKYLGKVTGAFPLTLSGYEMAAERMASG